ncbi:heme-dependent oxidative N-demethylase family protein [Gloeocapsopsis dulcis]|uniref:DUF3445 domain-containing protein n=1 Tax=Gloeocapsopsis dulcis AAB1 = 1H9 TaxID=1433147 RepID=A0A6N8FXG7_9CHRO|nr:DUF3445 domain-containing protein [Gloeocapsopsis dulcis]MUL36837.1 hypothetical protein [Gloeocapsopsis dulcis AAB1 = 1H9]WNN88557.1 DUF3445 domain-containing protein [Gloeocapsopsis dulcis]
MKPIYLPFADGQWRMAMGLKPLQLQHWIEIDEDFSEELNYKNKLLKEHYSDVVGSLPGSEAGQREVLELILKHLLQYFPDYYQQQGNCVVNKITKQVWYLSDFTKNPLDLAGRLVQEDLCLMQLKREYILTAGSVCFPARWRLSEKLGRPLVQIHDPVPDYAQKLEQSVNKFFDRLKPEFPGYRLNWGIVDSPELCLTQRHSTEVFGADITAENAGEKLWLRVERQTLRRLPVSGGILFTIRTYVYPLKSVVSDPAIASQLAAVIEQIPPQMQIYKNIFPIQTVLLAYLERVVAF